MMQQWELGRLENFREQEVAARWLVLISWITLLLLDVFEVFNEAFREELADGSVAEEDAPVGVGFWQDKKTFVHAV